MDIRIPVGSWIKDFFDWLEDTFSWLFEALRQLFIWMFDAVDWVFATPPALVVIALVAAAALLARGWRFALGSAIGLLFIMSVNQWDNAVDSLALVLVAAFLAVVISIPLGIWAARNDTVSAVLKPVMDFLQTLPAFVYLVPALGLFRIGVAPGIIATLIFAMAPGVRLTELGIRGVDKEVVEAGQAFGAHPRRILRQIQIPLAMPSIMAGVNQIIMLSLSMVVIAGLVGAGGLGGDVAQAISALNVGLGFEAGLSVVVLAILLDRFTASFGKGLGLYSRWRRAAVAKKEADEQARFDAELVEVGGPRRSPGAGGGGGSL
ncbi:ABC transporter permease subunit [Demequina sp. SYSU T00039]|uniref:ABC transporter permease subunit n=1 Tax=Demequina lignilytica TaxID=3051663 RepID=A0AAW7M069_9MICO|nr:MULTISPECIES: ABC transporter permease subunit [unclassified Demequina]MDN4479270.1 ABC transporter permease subunit [Demequina sp. SYSU T00039-1]MDN4487588.1 ABC transporter permease subunit [Demequina sp. SYSU T00039]